MKHNKILIKDDRENNFDDKESIKLRTANKKRNVEERMQLKVVI